MDINQHIPEQKIIDYVLGNLNGDENSFIKEHAKRCPICIESINNWQVIFQEKSTVQTISPDLKEQIWDSLQRRRNILNVMRNPKYIFSGAAISVIILLIVSLSSYNTTEQQQFEMVQKNTATEAFQQHPATKQINIIPVSQSAHINGNVWLNQISNEMMLEVNGLDQLSNSDYQLWIIYSDDYMEGAILPIHNGTSRIFFKDKDVNQFKFIKASVEPKGGSLVPTGPDTFIVKFD